MAFFTAVVAWDNRTRNEYKNDVFNQILSMSRFPLGKLVAIEDKKYAGKVHFWGSAATFCDHCITVVILNLLRNIRKAALMKKDLA